MRSTLSSKLFLPPPSSEMTLEEIAKRRKEMFDIYIKEVGEKDDHETYKYNDFASLHLSYNWLTQNMAELNELEKIIQNKAECLKRQVTLRNRVISSAAGLCASLLTYLGMTALNNKFNLKLNNNLLQDRGFMQICASLCSTIYQLLNFGSSRNPSRE